MYIYSNVTAGLFYVETAAPLDSYRISDVNGNEVNCPKLRCKQKDGGYVTTLDASELDLSHLGSMGMGSGNMPSPPGFPGN